MVDPLRFATCELFRGTAMSEAMINKIRQLAKGDESMCLYGFTSTSRFRSIAESFAFENKADGLKRVLIHIHWINVNNDHYYMNLGSFEHEEEILLYDGINYKVMSVQDPKYKLYRVTQDLDFPNLDFPKNKKFIKKGTKVLLVNDQPEEKYGYIVIKPLEGEISGPVLLPPQMIEFD